MSAEKERLILLNRQYHAPKLGTTFGTGFVNTQNLQIGWDVKTQTFMPIDCCENDENDPNIVWKDNQQQKPNSKVLKIPNYSGLVGDTTTNNGEFQLRLGFAGQAPGDLIKRTNNGWERLAAGATNYVLTSGGVQGPSWTAPQAVPSVNAKYLLLQADNSLQSARTLALGAAITMVDNGAGSTATIGVNFSSQFSTSSNELIIKDAAVELQKLAFQPRKDVFTGSGNSPTFNLTTRIPQATWRDAIMVARNGQVINQVASNNSPQGTSEYTCTDNGQYTQITLGANLGLNENLHVLYFA